MPGGQAEYLRVPQAHFGPIKVPQGPPDVRSVYLSDVLPTAWQAVVYADIDDGGTVTVHGLGPIGQMCARSRCTRAPVWYWASIRSLSGWRWPAATAWRC